MNPGRLWPLAAAILLSGCDPCSGVINCTSGPSLHIEGRIVDPVTGLSVPSVAVRMVLASGDSVATTSDGDGLFSATMPVAALGIATYDLHMTPPGESTFVERGRTCDVIAERGNGCPLGLINSRPYFPNLGVFIYRGSADVRVAGAGVTFRPTGGARLYGPAVTNGLYNATTGSVGQVDLFGLSAFTPDVEPVIGDLTVQLPSPLDSGVVRDLSLSPTIIFHGTQSIFYIPIGPSLKYEFGFFRGSAASPVSGVSITFTRTGGIPIDTTGLSGTSDAQGNGVLDPRAFQRGQVTGNLTVSPPAPSSSFVIRGVVLTTHDDDSAPIVGQWDVSAPPPIAALSNTFRRP